VLDARALRLQYEGVDQAYSTADLWSYFSRRN